MSFSLRLILLVDFGQPPHIGVYDVLPGSNLRLGARLERSLLIFGQFDPLIGFVLEPGPHRLDIGLRHGN